ncbi:MAG: amidohydrolase family protein [Verrucomicrobiota bacterium]
MAYSWTNDVPCLHGNPYRYSEYLAASEGTGITATIFMECTPDDPLWMEETKFVDELSHEPGSLIQGQIANCRPESDDFNEYLDSISDLRIQGLRRILHVAPEGTSDHPNFVPNLRSLEKRNLPFDLCVFEKQLPMAERITKDCPNVQFVLNHCGVPEIQDGDFESWKKSMRSISEVDNVACKISGVLAYCSEDNANTETIRPYIEYAIECFGWDRVVWGSDWPVVTMTSSLKNWVAATREILSSEDPENQAKLLHKNAERIYHLKAL